MDKAGKLFFYSETGTEGGYYAIQGSDSISYTTPDGAVFKHRRVYDPEDPMRRGLVVGSYTNDGAECKLSRPGDISLLDIDWDDGSKDLMRPSDTIFIEQWGYEGATIVKNHDRLTVFQRGIGSVALWRGEVFLERQDPYAEGSYAPFGFAAHYKPKIPDIPADVWSAWFIRESHWALLERTQE